MDKLNGDIIIYQTEDGLTKIDVKIENETVWLSQQQMAELFSTSRTNIIEHINNIYSEQELDKNSTCQNFRQVQKEGNRSVTREIPFYNLDMIISLGYRVNSKEATDFRIWATKTLKEYIKKGFVVNSEMLKNGPKFGKDYFDELLIKIKEIRASERRFYQKITDIYKECSFDYDKNSETTLEFYKNVQNKLHFAITGMTAPEIIYNRVDSKKKNMGLTTKI